jgi:PKD repeat protein
MRKIIFTIALMIFGYGLFAAPVSQQTAQQVAVNFYKHHAPANATDFSVANVVTGTKDGLTTYYVFNFNSGGWVMVSADDAVIPILAHSISNTFDANQMNPIAKWWVGGYSSQIQSIVNTKLDNKETSKDWANMLNDQFPLKATVVVAPLLTCTWNQNPYYNELCPLSGVTGCVATATGQVMDYWKYPTTGIGSHTDYANATAYTVDFGTTTYAWSSMPATLTSSSTAAQKTAVATLLYDVGDAVSMVWASSGSSASESDIPRALVENFGYQPSVECLTYANFTNADWLTMIENELNNKRPVLYAGSNTADGHSFVFDGYETGSTMFHVNWGWEGLDDNYYAVGFLNPAPTNEGDYNLTNQCVVRIQPKSAAPIAYFTANTSTPSVGGSVTFTDLTTNSPTTWSWTFAGGTPASYVGQTPPAITYTTAGKYTVTLTVSNATGNDTKTSSQMINVGGTAPYWTAQDLGYPKSTLFDNRCASQISICSPTVAWATIEDAGASTHYPREFAVTTNGGQTWTYDTITFTGSTAYSISNIDPLNKDTAYAAMSPLSQYGGTIAETVNGGKTWSLLASEPSYSTSWLDGVYFFDANNGLCYGDATTASSSKFIIYTTSNGGGSWTAITTAPAAATNNGAVETGMNGDFCASNDSLWFGTSEGNLYYTYNKGASWAKTTTLTLSDSCEVTPIFRPGGTGFVYGLNSTTYAFEGIQKSTNGGSSFAAKYKPTGYFVKEPDLAYIPGTASSWVDVAFGSGRGSAFSNNTDCASFNNLDTGSIYYSSVKFYSPTIGYAGSMVSNTNRGIFAWNPAVITGVKPVTEINDQVKVYPNPTSKVVNIELTGITNKSTIKVYNLVGENILTREVDPTFNNIIQLDLSSNNSGIYLVTVDTGKNIITKRVMLVK